MKIRKFINRLLKVLFIVFFLSLYISSLIAYPPNSSYKIDFSLNKLWKLDEEFFVTEYAPDQEGSIRRVKQVKMPYDFLNSFFGLEGELFESYACITWDTYLKRNDRWIYRRTEDEMIIDVTPEIKSVSGSTYELKKPCKKIDFEISGARNVEVLLWDVDQDIEKHRDTLKIVNRNNYIAGNQYYESEELIKVTIQVGTRKPVFICLWIFISFVLIGIYLSFTQLIKHLKEG